jgi:hypothetical protein
MEVCVRNKADGSCPVTFIKSSATVLLLAAEYERCLVFGIPGDCALAMSGAAGNLASLEQPLA